MSEPFQRGSQPTRRHHKACDPSETHGGVFPTNARSMGCEFSGPPTSSVSTHPPPLPRKMPTMSVAHPKEDGSVMKRQAKANPSSAAAAEIKPWTCGSGDNVTEDARNDSMTKMAKIPVSSSLFCGPEVAAQDSPSMAPSKQKERGVRVCPTQPADTAALDARPSRTEDDKVAPQHSSDVHKKAAKYAPQHMMSYPGVSQIKGRGQEKATTFAEQHHPSLESSPKVHPSGLYPLNGTPSASSVRAGEEEDDVVEIKTPAAGGHLSRSTGRDTEISACSASTAGPPSSVQLRGQFCDPLSHTTGIDKDWPFPAATTARLGSAKTSLPAKMSSSTPPNAKENLPSKMPETVPAQYNCRGSDVRTSSAILCSGDTWAARRMARNSGSFPEMHPVPPSQAGTLSPQAPISPSSSAPEVQPFSEESTPPQSGADMDEEEGFEDAAILSAYTVEEPEIVDAQRVIKEPELDPDSNDKPISNHTKTCRQRHSFDRRILAAAVILVLTAAVVAALAVTGQFDNKSSVTTSTDSTPEPMKESVSVSWVQIGPDLQGPMDDDEWGEHVTLSMAAVGGGKEVQRFSISAAESSISSENSGSVYPYDWNEEDGSFDAVGQALHGSSAGEKIRGKLSGDGNRLVISASFYSGQNGESQNIGRLLLYELHDSTWELIGDPIEGKNAKERFGATVDISRDGSVIAASAILSKKRAGCVRVYRFASGEWIQLGQDIEGPVPGEQFGWALALSESGTTVAAGPRNQNEDYNFGETGFNSGYIRVFHYTAGNWSLLGKTLAGEAAGDGFGRSVSLSHNGKIVAGGTWVLDPSKPNPASSRARAFSYDEAIGDWNLMGGEGLSPFGASNWLHKVSLSGNGTRMAVSSGEFGSESIGSVAVFQFSDGKWSQYGDTIVGVQKDFAPDIDLSFDGSRLLTAHPLRRTSGGVPAKGVARLFEALNKEL